MREIDAKAYYDVAVELAAARVRFAQSWQLARRRVNSDMAATQVAIEETHDDITILQAKLKIAEGNLT